MPHSSVILTPCQSMIAGEAMMSSPALFLRCAKRGKDSVPHPAQAKPAQLIEDRLPGRQVALHLNSGLNQRPDS